jgi:adenylate cyclase
MPYLFFNIIVLFAKYDLETDPVMDSKKIYREINTVRNFMIIGIIMGAVFACAEYFIQLNTDSQQDFVPLIVRALLIGAFITGSIAIFKLSFENHFNQKTFLYLVLAKSIFYTGSITFWLVLVNGVWFAINGGIPVSEELILYLDDEMYLINLSSIFIVIIGAVGIGQINSLHRKGELMNFILGRYHKPREVERIFCFIDLKDSTTIAEKLGHFGFASFLKDYYSDITEALRKTNAQIYQYVGDEVVLSWTFKSGLEDNNSINCFFIMKKIINNVKQKYITKYGVYPEFKAGLHGGHVIVTWVGELKKEIVYIGDVLNTTARIQEDCKRLAKDFLISEDLLKRISGLGTIMATFVEETIPRGKEERVKLYSLEKLE